MNADNRGVDHLDRRIVSGGECIYNTAPDTGPPSAIEAVIAGYLRAKMIRKIAPRCPRSQDPEDSVEDTSVVYPRVKRRCD
jgi:hypothetical protein